MRREMGAPQGPGNSQKAPRFRASQCDLIAILSAAFTIVSSRLSDSQFPIKVSVLDGWGAITIGFLSCFVGNKFIDSLRGLLK
jgi:hypothetical protein